MMHSRDSLIFSTLRSFLITVACMAGLAAGLIPFILIYTAVFGKSTAEPDRNYKTELVTNAEGVRKVLSKDSPVVLKLDVTGLIGTNILSAQAVRQRLTESREGILTNNRVKAILLYINSAGGGAIDSNGIYAAIKDYKKRFNVPVYAYIDGICASGGMYAAVAADKIYANNISLIGSIGVRTPPIFNVSEALKKIGIDSLTLTAGKGKDELNPFRPWTEEEVESVQTLLDYLYDQFVDVVIQNRPLISREKLVDVYGAHVFSAPKALEYGFIDGTDVEYEDVLKMLLKEIGIDDDYYQVIELVKKTWFTELFNGNNLVWDGHVQHHLVLRPEDHPNLMNQFLYLYTPEP